MLHHCQIFIAHTYRNLTMPVCPQLRDSLWDSERGFRLVETGLYLQAGMGSCPSSVSNSFQNLPHMTDMLV